MRVALLILVWTGVCLGQRSRESWLGSSCETAVKSARRPPRPAALTAAGGSDTQEIGAGLQGYKSAAHRNRGDREVRTAEMWAQVDRRLRPFARRAASTLRPAAVAMRARKPWRRLRTRLLGW